MSQEQAPEASCLTRREDVVAACGDMAANLKSYQLVGINFLMVCVHIYTGMCVCVLVVERMCVWGG